MANHLMMQIEQFCLSFPTSEEANQTLNLVNLLHNVVKYLWT